MPFHIMVLDKRTTDSTPYVSTRGMTPHWKDKEEAQRTADLLNGWNVGLYREIYYWVKEIEC